MNIKTLVVGPVETNCYIISDPLSKEAVIIDAGTMLTIFWTTCSGNSCR